MRMLILCLSIFFANIAYGELNEKQALRAKNLYNELRCVVCQNQSIAESQTELAKDLREIVRQEIKKGKTDWQIKDFLVSRYGEFILLKPRLSKATFILWFFPFFILLLSIVFLILFFKKHFKK